MPLKLITVVLPVIELLVTVSCPAAGPAVVGRNCTLSVAVWEGARVSGNAAPDSVKPVPVSATALMVTGCVPVDAKVTGCVTGVFTATSVNTRLVSLTLSTEVAALNRRETLRELPPEFAVSVIDCVVVTEDILAMNWAAVTLAPRVTVAGTVTAALLLVTLTLVGPLDDPGDTFTVQMSVPDPLGGVFV